MNIKFKCIAFLFCIATIGGSCKKDNNTPANQISDDGGINVSLTWTTNDGSNPVTTNNLELYIFQRNTMSGIANSTTNGFEGVSIIFPGDIALDLEVYFTNVDRDGTLKISFEGINNGQLYEVSRAYTRADEGGGQILVQIDKVGDNFTFATL